MLENIKRILMGSGYSVKHSLHLEDTIDHEWRKNVVSYYDEGKEIVLYVCSANFYEVCNLLNDNHYVLARVNSNHRKVDKHGNIIDKLWHIWIDKK